METTILFIVVMCQVARVIGEKDQQSKSERDLSRYMLLENNPTHEFRNNDELPTDEAFKKRYSSFVRIGKSPIDEKRYSSFVRIGKSIPADKRYSSFVRIGRSHPSSKRYSSFVRIGKSPFVLKRLSSFMRIGKSGADGQSFHYNRDDIINGINSYLNSNEMIAEQPKRYSSFVRIGKDLRDAQAKRSRYSSFVRIGKNYNDADAPLPLFRSNENHMDPSVPIFEDSNREFQKRLSSFVRIGKSQTDINHPFNLIKSPDAVSDSDTPINHETDSITSQSRRKRSVEEDMPEKRGFIRIGKIPSSAFMRIGRNPLLDSLMLGNYVREGRRGHSSFIRIGKRDGEQLTDEDIRELIRRYGASVLDLIQ